MQTLLRDFRYGLRVLMKQRGFTAIAVLALALGIGANVGMFSLVDAMLLRPLPFENMDRLVIVWGTLPRGGNRFGASPADFLDFRERQQVFESLSAYRWTNCNITGGGEPERVQGFQVTQNLFAMLGVEALRGRMFLPEEEQAGRDNVVVLSQGLWQRRYAADSNIIGQTITLNDRNYSVVGIAPDGYEWPMGADLWMPMVITPAMRDERQMHFFGIAGLIKPGVTLAQAQAAMDAIARRLAEEHPRTNGGRGVNLLRMPGQVADEYIRQMLALLLGGVAFVLLIACANVANLQLARATGRQREIAIRTALGASRWRIIRQLLVESVLLAAAGAALGLLIAPWLVDYARTSVPPDIARFIPGLKAAGIDLRTLGYTMAIGLLAGIVAGLAPAIEASNPNLQHTLKEGGRTQTGAGRRGLRGALVVCEVALALVLLIGTGLMVKSFATLSREHKQGFDPSHLLTMRLSLPESKYAAHRDQSEFYRKTLERIATIPGVESASFINNLPASNNWDTEQIGIEGRPADSPSATAFCDFATTSAGYLGTMRIPLVRGRAFTAQDGADAPKVAVISERMARLYWPDQSPIGQRIRLERSRHADAPWHTIVGVAGDVRQFVFDRAPRATVYVPEAQGPGVAWEWMTLVVRTRGEPLEIVSAVRDAIRGLDAGLPVYRVKTMEHTLAEHLSPISLSAGWMAGLGLLALVLAATGVYSVMAYAVSQRTHEIGIRIALGARESDVLRLIVGQGMKLVAVGLAIGLIAAFALGRALSGVVYGVNARDPITFVIVAAGLAAIALLACWLPARRATKVDPMVALRCE